MNLFLYAIILFICLGISGTLYTPFKMRIKYILKLDVYFCNTLAIKWSGTEVVK